VLRFRDGEGELPAAALPGVLAHLLATRRELFEGPLPPLERWLRLTGLEAFGGHVGLRGLAWNRGGAEPGRGSRCDARARGVAGQRRGAQADADIGPRHRADLMEPAQLLELVSTSVGVVAYLAGEVKRRTAMEGVTFTDTLEKLRAAAVNVPTWRALVALLSARAADSSRAPDAHPHPPAM
jgi:hypothetical protein